MTNCKDKQVKVSIYNMIALNSYLAGMQKSRKLLNKNNGQSVSVLYLTSVRANIFCTWKFHSNHACSSSLNSEKEEFSLT